MTTDTDVFELAIPKKKLAFTNGLWNTMKLNSPWIVGITTSIIQDRDFASKEEWRDYYFESGRQRLGHLKHLSPLDFSILTSVEIWNFYKGSSKDVNDLNLHYGRTQEELFSIGDMLYGALRCGENPLQITKKECRYMVMYRVLGETWNGLAKREKNTIKTMNLHLGDGFTTVKVSGEKDVRYEVDAEVYHENELVAGIQIKPPSYMGAFDNNQDTYDLNKRKNDDYTTETGVPVLYVYADLNGTIKNPDSLMEIVKLSQRENV